MEAIKHLYELRPCKGSLRCRSNFRCAAIRSAVGRRTGCDQQPYTQSGHPEERPPWGFPASRGTGTLDVPYISTETAERSFGGPFDNRAPWRGCLNCRRDLDGLYLVCSTTRDGSKL